MKILIDVKNPKEAKDLYWMFKRLEDVNEGTGVTMTCKHNSREKNVYYFDGDGGERITVDITEV